MAKSSLIAAWGGIEARLLHRAFCFVTLGSKIDYAQLIKLFGGETGETTSERKYSPGDVGVGTTKSTINVFKQKKPIP